MSAAPRVIRNDWSTVAVPDLDGWRPVLTVSVVIPAFRCQATLDLTLASLSRQTYPAELLEVIVVDDGSEPPLALPAIRPDRTALVRVGDSGDGRSGWGRANALRCGVAHSSGEILHWLDADMVAFPEHVAAQARWHHVLPYAVTLGYKRFVDPAAHGPWPTPGAVVEKWSRGVAGDLFGGSAGEPHTYVERYISQTDQLRTADHQAFRIHVGATAALGRELYDAAGGFDAQLRLGEDTEFGYRLAQAGAVFVPEPQARSWHLGRTQVMRAREQVARYNQAFFADRIPYPRHWRKLGGPARSVPLAEVVMPVHPPGNTEPAGRPWRREEAGGAGQPLERVRAAVDSVLRGTEPDVRVNLVGPWDLLDDARVPVLTDPLLDLRLIAASYRGEPRVRLVTEPPASAFPAPYLLELPVTYGLAPDALRRLVDLADRHQVGIVHVDPPRAQRNSPVGQRNSPGGQRNPLGEQRNPPGEQRHPPGAGGNPPGGQRNPPVRLWRTAAVSRARWVREERPGELGGESLLDAVTSVYGRRDVTATAAGIIDLEAFEPRQLTRGVAALARTSRRPAGLVPSTVEVEGVRSLAKATVVVAWLAGRRLLATLRVHPRRTRRPDAS